MMTELQKILVESAVLKAAIDWNNAQPPTDGELKRILNRAVNKIEKALEIENEN